MRDWSPFLLRWGMVLILLYPLLNFHFSTDKQVNLNLIDDLTPYLALSAIFSFMKHTLFEGEHLSPESDLYADKFSSAHLAFGLSLLICDYKKCSKEQKTSLVFAYSLFILFMAMCHIYNASRFQKQHEYMPGVVHIVLGSILFYISIYAL